MAPDKIWVTPSEMTDLLSEKRHDYDVAYIRKDIVDEMIKSAEDHAFFAGQEKLREKLIKWAEDMKRIWKGLKLIEETYQTMINKIESL